jgi:hypothetical protein
MRFRLSISKAGKCKQLRRFSDAHCGVRQMRDAIDATRCSAIAQGGGGRAYRDIVAVPSAAISTSTESDFSLGPLGSTVMLAVT